MKGLDRERASLNDMEKKRETADPPRPCPDSPYPARDSTQKDPRPASHPLHPAPDPTKDKATHS